MKAYIFIGCITLLSFHANAHHFTLGTNIGYGGHDFELSSKEFSGGDEFTNDYYARYQINSFFGVEIGYMTGVGGIGSVLVDAISEIKDIEYNGVRITSYGKLSLSKHSNIYGKLGFISQDVTYTFNGNKESDRSNGAFIAVGIAYQFSSGFGTNIEFQDVETDALDLKTLTIGISYAF